MPLRWWSLSKCCEPNLPPHKWQYWMSLMWNKRHADFFNWWFARLRLFLKVFPQGRPHISNPWTDLRCVARSVSLALQSPHLGQFKIGNEWQMSRLTRLLINNQPGFLPELSSSQAVHLPLVQQVEVPHHWKIAMIENEQSNISCYLVCSVSIGSGSMALSGCSWLHRFVTTSNKVQKEYLHRWNKRSIGLPKSCQHSADSSNFVVFSCPLTAL